MNGIERRLRRLEETMPMANTDLSGFNHVEIALARAAVMRRLLESDDMPADERERIAAELAEEDREAERWHAYYSRSDVAAAVASNVAAGHCQPRCTCGALPYPHEPHRSIEELCAAIAAWAERREAAR